MHASGVHLMCACNGCRLLQGARRCGRTQSRSSCRRRHRGLCGVHAPGLWDSAAASDVHLHQLVRLTIKAVLVSVQI